ncbi:MAG: ion channel [Desulforhopalus sp.]
MEFRGLFNRIVFNAQGPYGTLLLGLFAMLIVYPFLGSHRSVSWVLDIIMLGVVFLSLRIIRGRGLLFTLLWIIGISAFLLSVLGRSTGSQFTSLVGTGIRSLFMCYLMIIIFRDCMHRNEVTFDTICGASCVYVMLGLAFGSLYALLEGLSPGAFYIKPSNVSPDSISQLSSIEFDLEYFSFIAMTTVGFGDIIPVNPMARSMAALEGMLGQLYLTIIIARLVGLEIGNHLQRSEGCAERSSNSRNSGGSPQGPDT